MPFLEQGPVPGLLSSLEDQAGEGAAVVALGEGKRYRPGLLPVCANPACSSGWLRLWRGRQVPVFEGGWICGAVCAKALVRAALGRELKGREAAVTAHRHRIPLGLVLLSQGAITRDQLRSALARQKLFGGRIGGWLQRDHGVAERVITRALAAQWGCPVLTLENHAPERMAPLAPRLFLDAFGFLPLRLAGGALLYLGFEDRIDRSVCFAVERMSGLRVEAGLVDECAFAAAHRDMLEACFPAARMVEAMTIEALASSFARILEEARPGDARIVRIHDYFWMRLWKRAEGIVERQSLRAADVEDVLGYLATPRI